MVEWHPALPDWLPLLGQGSGRQDRLLRKAPRALVTPQSEFGRWIGCSASIIPISDKSGCFSLTDRSGKVESIRSYLEEKYQPSN